MTAPIAPEAPFPATGNADRAMRRRSVLAPLALAALLLAPAGIAARTARGAACPEGFACVAFAGAVLEIDKRHGAVCVVTRVETIRTETLAGVEETKEASCTEFEEAGGTYAPEERAQRLTPEQAAVADPGDFLVDRFAEPQ